MNSLNEHAIKLEIKASELDLLGELLHQNRHIFGCQSKAAKSLSLDACFKAQRCREGAQYLREEAEKELKESALDISEIEDMLCENKPLKLVVSND